MKILGQAQSVTGERSKRVSIPGWQRMKAGWTKIRGNSKPSMNVPLAAGATPIVETSLMIAQRNFAKAQDVSLGVTSIPSSASFPDGKVHAGMDKL